MFYNNLLYEHKNSVKNSFALFCTSTYNFTTVRVGVVVDTCHNALNCFKNPIAIYKCYKGFFYLLHCLVVTLSQTLNFTLAVMSELSPPPPSLQKQCTVGGIHVYTFTVKAQCNKNGQNGETFCQCHHKNLVTVFPRHRKILDTVGIQKQRFRGKLK